MTPARTIAAKNQPAQWWEQAFVIVSLLLLTGAFVNLFLTPEQLLDPAQGVPGMRFIWAAIYLITILFWLRYCKGSLELLSKQKLILLLITIAIVSAIWSDSPATTLRRSAAIVGTSLMALYFATRFTIRFQLRLLAWALGACVALSVLFGLFHWGRPVDDMANAWYGIYAQRNSLGAMMVLGALVFITCALSQIRGKWIFWLSVAASFTLVLLSGSVTSLVVFSILMISFCMIPMIRRFDNAGVFLLLCVIFLLALVWWVGTSFDAVTEAMGRDSSLTGRTELWGASILYALDRPWLGFGFNAFWLGADGHSADVWQMVGWAAPSAHNGLLELWLDLGIAGVALAVSSFVTNLRDAFRLVRSTARWEYAWPLLFLVVLFTMNLTESVFFQGNSIYWFLYLVVAFDVWRLLERLSRNQLKRLDSNRSGELHRLLRQDASE